MLVRHAQAADAATDRDRPLTRRGELHAETVGAWLARAGSLPERVLVSPARRTVQTWELARAALDGVPEPVLDERIYDNTVEDLLEIVRETSAEVRTLAVVGHNPSIGELARLLDDGEGSQAARQEAGNGFPPGAVAVLDVPGPFAEIAPGVATLVAFTAPGG